MASAQTVLVNEGFDNVGALTSSGWIMQNNSQNVGSIASWFQGSPSNAVPTAGPFDAYDGALSAYVAGNYNNVTGNGVLSNWLITPVLDFERNSALTFYTRIQSQYGQVWADRLQVRLCTKAVCSLPPGATSVGDYTTLLLDINPNENTTDYPRAWQQFLVNSGLPRHGQGRIAFRYYISGSAGPGGAKSDYIGIDRVRVDVSGGPAYRVSGTVSGLNGTGLVLAMNGGAPLPVTANGGFELPDDLNDAEPYEVIVFEDPSAPTQRCTVNNGTGTIAGDDVTNVAVTCVDLKFVTPSAGANGTIVPNTVQAVPVGGTTSFAVTAAPHYVPSVGGTCAGSFDGTAFATSTVLADCTVAATFALDSHTVTHTAGTGGSITPSGTPTVTHGDTRIFTVTPAPHHHLVSVSGCGGSFASPLYTTGQITADCTVSATFALDSHTVTAAAGSGGQITPEGVQTVVYGDTRTFAIVPDAHHHIVEVTGCGGVLTGTSFTTAAIEGDCAVAATFAIDSYEVTASAGENGTITPAGSQSVEHGETRTFTITPEPLYAIGAVSGCDGTLTDNTFTTAPIVDACTVTASFTRAIFTRYFAEGASNHLFATRIALFNPDSTSAAAVTVTLFGANGQERTLTRTVPALRRVTIDLNDPADLPGTLYSTRIESDQPIVADRLMTWDGSGYGSSLETATDAPGTDWYLAEGATGGPFSLYYLLQNPGDADASVTVRYLRAAPLAPVEKTYTLAARSRMTIDVAGEDSLLAAGELSAHISATQPIVVERAMYRSTPEQPLAAGHAGLAVAAPATRWFIGEGATGFFDEFVLMANPTAQPAAITVTYLPEGQASFTESFTVEANSRYTLELKRDPRLAAATVSMIVESTNTVPVVAERVMWWPTGGWYETSLSAGVTTAAPSWAFAEGEQGGTWDNQTYVAIANVDPVNNAAVQVRFFAEDGTLAEDTIIVPAGQRRTVDLNDAPFAALAPKRFGALITSSGPAIVVERSMYQTTGNRMWNAGGSSVGTVVGR